MKTMRNLARKCELAILSICLYAMSAVDVAAQSNTTGGMNMLSRGQTALQGVKNQLQGYIGDIIALCYIIALIAGIVGALGVYNKYKSGDQDAQKRAFALAAGVLIFVGFIYALQLFFLGKEAS